MKKKAKVVENDDRKDGNFIGFWRYPFARIKVGFGFWDAK